MSLVAALAAAPAAANVPATAGSPARDYVAARAAGISGDHAGAAELYAKLATSANDPALRQRAISEAINAGDMDLALRLARQSGAAASVDTKLLLVADALKRKDIPQAMQLLADNRQGADLSFWSPLVQAWALAERRDAANALAVLSQVPANSALAPFADEQSALILLKLRKPVEADPYARRAVAKAGAREYRLRVAFAAGFAAAGDEARAAAMIDGLSGDASLARRAIAAGKVGNLAIDDAADAFAEQLIALALEMSRAQNAPLSPINIARVARFAAPQNSSAAVLLGNLLVRRERVPEALQVLRSVGGGDLLKPEALDVEARALLDAKRYDEALALARGAASRPDATADDFARLGDFYGEIERHVDAANAYAEAVRRIGNAPAERVWPLLLLQASEFESAGLWPQAKAALGSALAIAPNEPLVLNFLGYAKLEHGEDLDAAEALIRKASELAPDNASITDSLGWALYKRGRIEEAIDVLEKAALGDPGQAEIQEHLGDALYSAGRRFEARFAWQAALATADEEDSERIRRKIETGLNPATAAR